MPQNVEYVKFKNYGRKIKSQFMIYADFESILVPKNNENQNSNETYTNKHQKNVFTSDGYKLVCVDDTFNKAYLCEDGIYSFINSICQRK